MKVIGRTLPGAPPGLLQVGGVSNFANLGTYHSSPDKGGPGYFLPPQLSFTEALRGFEDHAVLRRAHRDRRRPLEAAADRRPRHHLDALPAPLVLPQPDRPRAVRRGRADRQHPRRPERRGHRRPRAARRGGRGALRPHHPRRRAADLARLPVRGPQHAAAGALLLDRVRVAETVNKLFRFKRCFEIGSPSGLWSIAWRELRTINGRSRLSRATAAGKVTALPDVCRRHLRRARFAALRQLRGKRGPR